MTTPTPPRVSAPPEGEPARPEPTGPGDWHVCHTRPRCEKKLAEVLSAEGWEHYLPLAGSVRRYGTRTKRFTKPLFPGYVFARIPEETRARVFQRELVARLLRVEKEDLLLRQLDQVRRLLASGLEFSVRPLLARGHRVRIQAGPLWGVEGVVEDPQDPRGVVIAVDVLRQGVQVRVPPEHLELVS